MSLHPTILKDIMIVLHNYNVNKKINSNASLVTQQQELPYSTSRRGTEVVSPISSISIGRAKEVAQI